MHGSSSLETRSFYLLETLSPHFLKTTGHLANNVNTLKKYYYLIKTSRSEALYAVGMRMERRVWNVLMR